MDLVSEKSLRLKTEQQKLPNLKHNREIHLKRKITETEGL
jgi:hypothetical protein